MPDLIRTRSLFPETMRAAVLFGPSDLRVVERPVPTPGPGEVLVKVAACAICGTDPKLIAHPFPSQPPFGEFIPGHEWTGTVVALGETVDELQVGDKVAAQSHRGCMRCENCLQGDYTVCLNYGNRPKVPPRPRLHHGRRLRRVRGPPPQCSVYTIPDERFLRGRHHGHHRGHPALRSGRGRPLVAGETRSRDRPGPIGLADGGRLSRPVRRQGDPDRHQRGSHAARPEFGRRRPGVCGRGGEAMSRVRQLTGGLGVDLAVDCAGGPTCPDDAIKMTKRGGRVLLVAVLHGAAHRRPRPGGAQRHHSVYHPGRGPFSLPAGPVDDAPGQAATGQMVTHQFTLERVRKPSRLSPGRKGNAIKVLVKP